MSDGAEVAVSDVRYQGRPLLRFLDCYVLALIGHLAPDMEDKVSRATLAQFGGSEWKATLRETVKLPADMDERIKSVWRTQPAGTDPMAFALAVSDENFVPLIDPT